LRYTPAAAWDLGIGRDKPKELHVWVKGDNIFNLVIKLRSGASAYFFYRYDGLAANQWHDILLRIGPSEEFASGWAKVFGPSWSNITSIELATNLISTETMRVDGLYFGKIRFSGLAEDAASQATYGVQISEPIVDDALKSDAECLARAQSLRDYLKDPAITLEDVTVDGDYRINPGDRQRIIVSNDALDDYFRVTQITEKIRGPTWDMTLAFSNEPSYVEYPALAGTTDLAPSPTAGLGSLATVVKKIIQQAGKGKEQ
jgi:hypothetical protein